MCFAAIWRWRRSFRAHAGERHFRDEVAGPSAEQDYSARRASLQRGRHAKGGVHAFGIVRSAAAEQTG